MLRRCGGGIVALSMLVAGGYSPAAAPDPLAANAALHYWRALSLFPNLDDKREAILRDAVEKLGPVDEKTAEVIGLRKLALRELHRGAAYPRCVWATPLDGVRTVVLLPIFKAGQLAQFACARAHLSFQQGRPAAAIDDLVATMTFGRHLASEGIVASVSTDHDIQRQAIRVAARHLGELQPAQLDEFAARIERLPPATTTRRAMQVQRECLLESFIRDLSGPNAKEEAAVMLKILEGLNFKGLQDVSPEQLRDAAIALRPVYDKIAAMMDGPPAELKSPEAMLAGLSQPARALAFWLLPLGSAAPLRTYEMAEQTRLAMLKAALAVVRGGPEALKAASLKDPYASEPFSYEKTPAGFRLVSKTPDRDGKPVTLEIGQRASK